MFTDGARKFSWLWRQKLLRTAVKTLTSFSVISASEHETALSTAIFPDRHTEYLKRDSDLWD